MNDTKELEAELLVECNRPVRDETKIHALKTLIALAHYANKGLRELDQ